jgi:uncharacterized protein (TIGR03083 family)
MTSSLSYEQLVAHVAERSAVLRSAVAGVLDAPVPACPDWTGRDLVAHLGEVQRSWAANVLAGPADSSAADVADTEPSGDLLDWSEGGTDALVAALRGVDPDQGVWTWWREPKTVAAVARHQVQEAAVHAWDALDAAGRPEALPTPVALDGIDEFFAVEVPGNQKWPHADVTVAVVAQESPDSAWLVALTDGVGQVSRGPAAGDAVLRGSASDLVLALYGRRGLDPAGVSGDRELAGRFLDWFVTG